ncbi:glutaminyl-peptide cyclotransferase [Sphingosinicella sp. CPCC 101087]|uniref:glutaminyl-peptide cyclotransferase n=1 Tax=Sphingosinicella sp. CPCC 101087 TaxID=2497754 RepID=UPI00101B967B|nr:glutaminyl-peptide cyclotransferase [Sphingosinicella sp. CPCC 101087]
MRTALIALIALVACGQAPAPPADLAREARTPVYDYRVVRAYPHDGRAFTQGLFYLDGDLYESTGHVGQSTIRRVNLEDGRVVQSADIPPPLFGEGIVNWADQIISISWRSGIGFRWDRATLRRMSEWRYPGEGWGLTQNGREIIMSDGTAQLRFLDPETLAEQRRVTVTDGGTPVPRLNELEWVNGEVFANVWMTPMIARIDPTDGRVTGWIDLTELVRETSGASRDSVLNGIAYDAAGDRLFVTGKYWPRLYEIDIVPVPAK